MGVSNEFLYKPVSESNGNLVVLTPNIYNDRINQVEIVDSQGNVVEQGRFAGNQHNGARGHFRFNRPGAEYGNNFSVRITYDDGTDPLSIPISDGGARYTQNYGSSGATGDLSQSGGGGGYRAGQLPGTQPVYDEEGNLVATAPGQVDYGAITPSYVDYLQNLGLAQIYGNLAAQQYYTNIDRSRDPALGVIQTDIMGITQGLDALAPRSREEGRADLRENIARARELDQFNFSRLEGVNAANRQMAEQANEFNMAQQEAAQEATGLGYRQRINDLLDRLETRAETGRMGPEFDEALNIDIASRSSDLLGTSGISAISGAGVRARDRMMIQERMNLALGAESQMPGILQTAQATLQFQPERAPTAYAQPTQVPLNPSAVEARMPIMSGISAGQAQMSMAGTATQLQAIPATGILSSALSTAQFNEQARYNHEVLTADREQSYNNAMSNIGQGIINQEYAEQLRQEQYDAYGEGVSQRRESDWWGAAGQAIGIGAGIYAGMGLGGQAQGAGAPTRGATQTAAAEPPTTIGGQQVVGSAQTSTGQAGYILEDGSVVPATKYSRPSGSVGGSAQRSTSSSGRSSSGSSVVDTILNAPQDVANFIGTAYDSIKDMITPTKEMRVGNKAVSDVEYNQAMKDFQNLVDGTNDNYSSTSTGYSTPQSKSNEAAMTKGAAQLPESGVVGEALGRAQTFIDENTKPIRDFGVDERVLTDGIEALTNWDNMSESTRMNLSATMGINVLENRGIVDSDTARELRASTDAISTLMNPDSTTAQRATAIGVAAAEFATTSFTGDIANPTTIGGQAVMNQTVDNQGNTAFQLEDGSIVSQSTLENGANTLAAAQALGVLTSGASDEQKIRALSGIGINAARANQLISQTAAGNSLAALSIINTAMDWDNMSNFQRAASIATTSRTVYNSVSNLTTSSAQQAAGSSVLSYSGGQAATTAGIGANVVGGTLSAAAGFASVAAGVDQAADVFAAYDDMPKSKAEGYATTGLASAGAAIGGGLAGATAGIAAATGTLAGATVMGASIGSAAFPVIGTAIGAAVGAVTGAIVSQTGSGKNTGQMMRDSWRDGMLNAGFASKNKDGDVTVKLADGSNYNIGIDGNHKLVNKDGSERHSFDVDWSNQAAVDSIPEAHLFAMATGLDPTTAEGHDLFHRAVGQSLNAASSNANTAEGIRDNFKSMMTEAGVDPRELGMRIETLRATNKITDQEYGVYLDKINSMFGTKLQPTDIDTSRQKIVNMIRNKPQDQLNEYDTKLLNSLTDPKLISDSEKALSKRLGKEKATREGKKYRSEKENKILQTLGVLPGAEKVDLGNIQFNGYIGGLI